jgi:hypothetical protein
MHTHTHAQTPIHTEKHTHTYTAFAAASCAHVSVIDLQYTHMHTHVRACSYHTAYYPFVMKPFETLTNTQIPHADMHEDTRKITFTYQLRRSAQEYMSARVTCPASIPGHHYPQILTPVTMQ